MGKELTPVPVVVPPSVVEAEAQVSTNGLPFAEFLEIGAVEEGQVSYCYDADGNLVSMSQTFFNGTQWVGTGSIEPSGNFKRK